MISNGKGTHTHTTTKLNTSKQQFSRLSERTSINLDQPTSVPVYCATILWEFEPILDIYKNLDSRMSVNEVYNFTIWSAGWFPRPGWRVDRSLPWLQLHLFGWARLLVNIHHSTSLRCCQQLLAASSTSTKYSLSHNQSTQTNRSLSTYHQVYHPLLPPLKEEEEKGAGGGKENRASGQSSIILFDNPFFFLRIHDSF